MNFHMDYHRDYQQYCYMPPKHFRQINDNSNYVQENNMNINRKKYLPPLTQVRHLNRLPIPKQFLTQVPPTSFNHGVVTARPTSEVSRSNSILELNSHNNNNNTLGKQNNDNMENGSFNLKIFGSTENEKTFIFTGTVERVIKWNKIFQNHFCYYEVIASVISIQEGSVNNQKIMLLRDKKGPILQVVYYFNTRIDIEDFHVEQVLRCVGRMSSPNILNAISIRAATQEEIETLQRLSLVCDRAISHFLTV